MTKTYEQAREDLRQATQDLAAAYRDLGDEIGKLAQDGAAADLLSSPDQIAELQALLMQRSGAYMAACQAFEDLEGICGSGT